MSVSGHVKWRQDAIDDPARGTSAAMKFLVLFVNTVGRLAFREPEVRAILEMQVRPVVRRPAPARTHRILDSAAKLHQRACKAPSRYVPSRFRVVAGLNRARKRALTLLLVH